MTKVDGKRVLTIVGNYFGPPPNILQLWLDSCLLNSEFNWIVFTDIDVSGYDVPANVEFCRMTQDEFRRMLQAPFPYPVRYIKPWDACAFKPCSGRIFKEYLKESDFWGWTDFDLLYGNLTPVYDLTARYDKVMPNGHLSLIRNDEKLNEFIMRHPLTERAVSARYDGLSCYDEGAFRTRVLPEFGASEDGELVPYIHLRPRAGSFRIRTSYACDRILGLGRNPSVPLVVTWHNGNLIAHFAVSKDKVIHISVAYIHFFRREITSRVDRLEANRHYLIKPNEIIEFDGHYLKSDEISKLDHRRLHWKYFKDRLNFKVFKRKVKRLFVKGKPYE